MQCSPPQYFNGGLVRQCSVGLRVGRFTARQECDQWCWAACAQAAFDLAGYAIDQEHIVERVFGSHWNCRPNIGPGIAAAIEGEWEDNHGEYFYATTRTLTDLQFGVIDPFALQHAAEFLANDVPLIVGSLGHATLMTAITWLEDNFGQYRLQEIIVRDPWPTRPNRRRLTGREFYGTTYVAAVLVD